MKSRTSRLIATVFLLTLATSLCLIAQETTSPDHQRHHRYRLVDLGTFGGPGSMISFSINGGPYINSSGDVVGNAQNATPLSGISNYPYECFPGPNVNHTLLWHNGHSLDLGAFSPSDENCSGSNAAGINDAGEITFQSEIGTIDPLLGVKQLRSAFWRRGHATDLGTLGGNATGSLSINNRSQVAGFSLNAVPDPYSFYGLFFEGSSNSTQTRGFLWQDGSIRDLETLGGPDALGMFINQSGQVAGLSYTNSIPNPTTGVPTIDPFFWDRGRMIDIGTLGGVVGGPNRMNNRGQVVGESDLAGDLVFHAFLWDRGVLRDLGTLGGSTSQATSINDAGDIVGVADLPGDASHDAVLWRNQRMIDLGKLGLTSFAHDINNSGQIVGASGLADGTIDAFLWENGGPMVDLNDLIPPSGFTLVFAEVINDKGIIAGTGNPADCNGDGSCQHGFVLIPDGDCDDNCEQRLADHQRDRDASAQLARSQTLPTKAQSSMAPAERLRRIMSERFGLSVARPTLRD